MPTKQKDFLPNDRNMLEMNPGVTWVPPKPADLLLPYMEKDPKTENIGVQSRLERAQEILRQYEDIAKKCQQMEDEICERCKKVSVTIDPGNISEVTALTRVFGEPGSVNQVTTITFDMYKMAVQALSDMDTALTPLPEK